MTDVIKLDYAEMSEMARQCKATSDRLAQTVTLARQIAQQMQNGALVGDAGATFAGALNSSFCPSVSRLSQKFAEVARDIEGAISDMRAADSSKTTQLFN